MLTPEALISIPEFDGPWPDSSGNQLLYIKRTFSPETHSTCIKLNLLNSLSGVVKTLRQGPGIIAATWIQGTNRIILFESWGEDVEQTDVLVSGPHASPEQNEWIRAGVLPCKTTCLGSVAVSTDLAILAFSAASSPDDRIYDEQNTPKSWTSGRVYRTMPVRNVDEWASPTKLTVFCSTLSLASSVPHLGEPFNTLSGLDQDFKIFGGMHMTQHGIALVAGDHTPSVAGISLSTVFYLSTTGIVSGDHSTRMALKAPGFHGFSSSPQIWDNGSKINFLQKRHGWLEDDPTLIVTCELWNSSLKFSHCEVYRDEATSTTLSPLEMKILDDGNPVFIAEDMAEVKLFSVHHSSAAKLVGRSLTKDWSLEAFHLLTDQSDQSKKILAIGSTLNVSRRWATLDSSGVILRVISEATEEEQRLQIDKSSYESIQWLGADDIPVQAWLVKPRTFDPKIQYPLLYCIHGGPSAAINNAWPAGYWRNLNFALLAEQGYIVVVPNASGSTGFGHQYAKRVLNDWGGRPYVDHVKGFSYIQSTLPYVDTKRSVAFGMSYGGFMINWMNGQPLGREFKAMISECGFANNSAQYTGDLVWFEDHFGGPMYQDSQGYQKFNPMNHTGKWCTPTLFISNELDYRVPVVEGIAAFQILQAKGIESQLLSFPDEGHITTKPDNRLKWWHTVIDWCNEHTKEEHCSA